MAKRTWKKSWEDFRTRLYQMTPEDLAELVEHVKFAANNGPEDDLKKLRAKKESGKKLSQMEEFRLKELTRIFAGLPPTKN